MQLVVIQSLFIAIFSFLRHREHSLLKKLWMIITTPVLLAPVLGLIFNHWEIKVPAIPLNIALYIGHGASSIALFSFGLNIGDVALKKETFSKPLTSIIVIKNLIHPLIAFVVGKYAFGLNGYWLQALIISSAAPTAFIVYLLAKQYQIEEELMKQTVAISSIFSMGSLLLIALYLGNLST